MPRPEPQQPDQQRRCARCGKGVMLRHKTRRAGFVCIACAMHGQALDDAQRWAKSARMGESPKEKCAREAREWSER
jgi:hypothetical protein